ncbi:MAG: hypothetical protein HY433_03305 [Candidatus Liptonbacteria bacterium]|nr:hypothetical protein [Candidatus Liptonbacteria bacterium]
MFKSKKKNIDLEESLSVDSTRSTSPSTPSSGPRGSGQASSPQDEWRKSSELVEVPLGDRAIIYLGTILLFIGIVIAGRIFYLGVSKSNTYVRRAQANLNRVKPVQAPRGVISDRNDKALADNLPVFSAFLNVNEFLRMHDFEKETLDAVEGILGISPDDIWAMVENTDPENSGGQVVLNSDLTQEEIVKLKGLNLPAIAVSDGFKRRYPDGSVFSSVIGYTGFVASADLKNNPELTGKDVIGKAGAELFYDNRLRGKSGAIIQKRDARGKNIGDEEIIAPEMGEKLRLTIDGEFQKYFYGRMKSGLDMLGRTKGVGLALNPRNGEILSLINFPVFDNNILSSFGRNSEKKDILNSADNPLFARAVAGFYNPGSTIKPLVGTAALKEGVINQSKKIFSPGYLDIPNPYNPDSPTRFLDWRYQGDVDLSAAIAQSSNVYFYEVGGGGPDTKGIGITKLREWWQKFNLGSQTGIDLPGEAKGFLPSPGWKEKKTGKPWLLGDTYNVSIGQGDLLLTPIQLLSYIGAIANGGKMYQPVVNQNEPRKILTDLSELEPQFFEVRKGMREAVTSNLGTAHNLADLGFPVEAKTGSAQTNNNEQENAFFVGYIPSAQDPLAGGSQIAILVLIENSREGSLNAVPIAKDVLSWYYRNRIKK